MYNNLFKESQQYKRQVVGVDEIKKDRDERVAVLRAEMEALQTQLDKMNADYASLKVQYKSMGEDFLRLKEDYRNTN